MTGYMLLLVRAYPDGIFGDTTPPAGLASLYGEVVPTVPLGAPPRGGRLLLTRGAKNMIVAFICLGVIYDVGRGVGNIESLRFPVEHPTASDFATDYNVLVDQLGQDTRSLRNCPVTGPSSCSEVAASGASDYGKFVNELPYLSFQQVSPPMLRRFAPRRRRSTSSSSQMPMAHIPTRR